MRIRNRAYLAATMVSAAALLVAGCSSGDTSDSSTPANTSAAATESTAASSAASSSETVAAGDCAKPSAKVTDANHKPGEPTFGLVTPAGWDRVTKADSDVVRLAVRNSSLASDNFAPNAVVTVEKSPETDIASEMERQLAGLKQSTVDAVDVKTQAAGTTCGFPSQTLTYQMKNSTGSMSSVTGTLYLVPNATGSTVAVLTVQTTDPGNQEYQETMKQMIKEFQIEK